MSDYIPISTPMSITGDVAPVALFSPEPPSSVQVAVGLAEVGRRLNDDAASIYLRGW